MKGEESNEAGGSIEGLKKQKRGMSLLPDIPLLILFLRFQKYSNTIVLH